MIRITTLFWVALLVVAGGTVMHVSYQVRHLEKHLSEIAKETRQEQGNIRILTAEWETLNDPRRIDDLAKRYLTLGSTPIQRVVALEAVPLMPTDEQLAKFALAASGKSAKGRAPTKTPVAPAMPIRPDSPVQIASRKPAPVPAALSHAPAVDPVGLILARVERSE